MHGNTRSPILATAMLAALAVAPAAAQSTIAHATVPGAAHAAPASRVIAVGETKTGSLTGEDPRLDDGEHYHAYDFAGRAGERVIVTLRSTAFDSYLAIFTTESEWENQDDDGGSGSDAQLDVTLPETGRYVILVTSYDGDETGDYTLSVRAPGAAEQADAESWTPYGRTSDTGAELSYLASSIRRQGNDTFEVWTRWVYPAMQPPTAGDASYDNEKRLVRVDCAADRLGLVSFVEYAGDSAVNNWTADSVDMSPAVPGSVGGSLVARICANKGS